MENALFEHTDIPDRTFPINVFQVSLPHPTSIPLHWHDHLEWMLVRRGAFRVRIGSHSEELGEGDMLFVNAGEIHAAFPLGDDTELIAIVFNDALLRNSALDRTERAFVMPILNREITVPSVIKASHPLANAIGECLERIDVAYREKRKGYELFIKSDLLRSIAYLLSASEDEPPVDRAAGGESSIEKFLRHVSSRFREPITIEEASAFCNLSPNYFCALFKKTTGKTFTEYLNMLRVHEAEQLLRTGQTTVSEAARISGFSNLTYFGRVFKQFKGVRPSEILGHAKALRTY
ncbi:helix-turn-helix domain-containing protein [Cohnella thailandensis]|uniref:Helix-turn-helix domain-containing protein n=1 Tax=Cohnella thailandensis TaxID=557557 RepID=A0A841T0J1_9BACL|nr:helix-turn-helix domain-containing protein [Cohnella thailandensis]MBP1972884.1 AraC-like DNA-binding protein/quercetin dioxygenase-like cupin family protein [Cohnella thailandensis]